MKLPLVISKNVILVVCNRLSKITHFMTTIERLAKLFRNDMYQSYEAWT